VHRKHVHAILDVFHVILKFDKITQVAIVVNDLGKTMKHFWEELGVGPWKIWTLTPENTETTLHGKRVESSFRVAMAKVGVSVFEMQRLLGVGCYETAWLMAHKVRRAMTVRDERYSLAGLVEMDESFFGPAGTTRGRGSECKSVVLCAVSLYRNHKGEEKPGFAHMRIVNDASAETIEDFLERLGCSKKTKEGKQLLETIRSDGWRSYGKVAKDKNLAHCKIVLRDPRAAGRLMPWIHRIITNAKSVIRGTHRGVSGKHLQAYLSEITYRFNRRFWGKELFDRLIQACVRAESITYEKLVHSTKTHRLGTK